VSRASDKKIVHRKNDGRDKEREKRKKEKRRALTTEGHRNVLISTALKPAPASGTWTKERRRRGGTKRGGKGCLSPDSNRRHPILRGFEYSILPLERKKGRGGEEGRKRLLSVSRLVAARSAASFRIFASFNFPMRL